MKILAVNKFYYRRAGAETAFFDTADLLRSHGHSVVPWAMHHPENAASPYSGDFVSRKEFEGPNTPAKALRAAGHLLFSFEARRSLERLIVREKPDIAHLHNIYHHLSPSILGSLWKHRIPTVLTLHDFKVVCPAYTLFSKGRPCERCRNGRYSNAVLRRCGKGSLAKSVLLAAEAYLHGPVLHSYGHVDLFLSPSRFLMDEVRKMGFAGRIVHLPNVFLADRIRPSRSAAGRRIVFAGRLAPEKGVETLLEAVGGLSAEVRIIGSGPSLAALKRISERQTLSSISFPGHLPFPRLVDEIRDSLFVVCPSEWYENLPYAVLEAFAAGKPVVASRIGGLPEIVREGETGLLFEPGDAAGLRRQMRRLLDDPGEAERMGANARAYVETSFEPNRAYDRLMAAYARAAERNN